jgi:hypothetical protein
MVRNVKATVLLTLQLIQKCIIMWPVNDQILYGKKTDLKLCYSLKCSTIHNSQVMEAAQMPHYWRMDQENVLSIHNGILCSHEEEQNVIILW